MSQPSSTAPLKAPLPPSSEMQPTATGASDGSLAERLRRAVFGAPRDIHDSRIFHHISLIPFLAWVGLGADGLSSSAYGPEEAFKTLGHAQYLAVGLALATAVTVYI